MYILKRNYFLSFSLTNIWTSCRIKQPWISSKWSELLWTVLPLPPRWEGTQSNMIYRLRRFASLLSVQCAKLEMQIFAQSQLRTSSNLVWNFETQDFLEWQVSKNSAHRYLKASAYELFSPVCNKSGEQHTWCLYVKRVRVTSPCGLDPSAVCPLPREL